MLELYNKSDAPSASAVNLEQALRIPLGVASPLWLFIGGAASAGMAYWWATQWLRPANLEAMIPSGAEALLRGPVGGEAGPLAGAAALAAAEEIEQAASDSVATTLDPTIEAAQIAPEPASFVSEPELLVEIGQDVALAPPANDSVEPSPELPPVARKGKAPPSTPQA